MPCQALSLHCTLCTLHEVLAGTQAAGAGCLSRVGLWNAILQQVAAASVSLLSSHEFDLAAGWFISYQI